MRSRLKCRPYSSFCANCSRLRITPDGKIKPCLLRNDNLVDIITDIRNNESEEKLEEAYNNNEIDKNTYDEINNICNKLLKELKTNKYIIKDVKAYLK